MKAEIEDTYAEAFDGIVSRVIVTADHQEVLKLSLIHISEPTRPY